MKTKFNEKDVPSWCKWIAVDEDGMCVAFNVKPKSLDNVLGGAGFWDGSRQASIDCLELYKGKPPKNWKDELYTWRY